MSACEELVGRAEPPRDQVPDDRADERREDEERIDDRRIHDALADRLGDAVSKENAATKLKNAAQMTAWPGVSTRVETTVAMEFAAS